MATVPEHLEILSEEELYPSSDGEPLGETDFHILAITNLYVGLKNHFRGMEVLVTSNMFWYWEEGNPAACCAPDVMVVKGVSNESRRTYLSWKEKVFAPCTIVEVTSEKTKTKDFTKKKADYERLGVKEYFLFDPEGIVMEIPLQGFALRGKKYVPLKPDKEGRLVSKQLDLYLREEGSFVRLINRQTGEKISTPEEEHVIRQQAEKRVRQLEEEIARLKTSPKKGVNRR